VKVLIINVRIGTGSVGRIVSDLYHGAVNAGHQCKVAYARGDIGDLPETDTYRICSENEVRVHAGLTRALGNTAFYFAKTTRRFCEWIKKYDPDVVHIHSVYGYYLNMKELFDYLGHSRACVISTLHSCWDFTGHCCYFDYVQCNQWLNGCNNCKQKTSYPKSYLDNTKRNFLKKKKAYEKLSNCVIVTPSTWLANLVRQSFLKDKEIRVIYNGVDIESFKPTEQLRNLGIDDRKPIILCVASIWERRKGWEDVVALSKEIDERYQLVVVGVTERQKNELGGNTVALCRTNSKAELASLYSAATVFFNPTYEDNYPTVNLEAIACHTPVVTYQTGGSPEALNNERWGKVINFKDYTALIDYTDRVHNKEIIIDFSESGLMSNEHMVRNYLSLYAEVTQ